MGLRERNVLSFLEDKTNIYGDRVALGIKEQFGWKEFTYRGLGLLSRKLADYLLNDLKVTKGERLAILSESKPEYGACVFASIISGMTTVPLDVKLTIHELTSILSDCEPTVILTSEHYLETAQELQKRIPSIKEIIVINEHSKHEGIKNIYELSNGANAKWVHRSRKSTMFIIYTSGTTGAPKGVEITFGNIMAQLDAFNKIIRYIIPNETVNVLSILPMNHLFEMTVGFSTFLNFGFSVFYTQSLKPHDIMSIMKEKQIQFMIVVPAFLKLLRAGVLAEIEKSSFMTKFMFKFAYNLAWFLPFYSVKKLLFKKIHDKFGGHIIGYITGGAPLDIEVGKFFERIGMKVYQGYGLSETSPVVCVNYGKRNVISSVGKPFFNYEYKTDKESGELLLRGPSVMKGYHNQPELTAEAIDKDGWLHTGDIARIDKDGYVYITGRIKNMIVLNGGKKVFPEEVEAVIEKSEYVAEVCVFGYVRTSGNKDGTEEIVAVVVPPEKYFSQYDDETLNKLVIADVKQQCQQLTQYKRPVTIVVRKEAMPKTTTRKIKRKEVKELVFSK